MSDALQKKAQVIQELLVKKGLECQVVEFPKGTRTSADAAACIGCDLAQIAKSLIFKTAFTSRPVLILASGSNRVDEKRLEDQVKEKIEKADANFTKSVTGFSVGGIPPIGHKNFIPLTFIDEDLLRHETVWTAAGTPHSVFNIRTQDLIALTKATVISIHEGA